MADNENNDKKEEKIEVCYTCGKEFDMNSDEGAHYRSEEHTSELQSR